MYILLYIPFNSIIFVSHDVDVAVCVQKHVMVFKFLLLML